MKFSNFDIPVCEENKPKAKVIKSEKIKTSTKFACRDPFVLLYDGKYYFYQSAGASGMKCSVSDDLENWSEPVMVYNTPEDFHGIGCYYWAPECHYYNGYFYIFTSVQSKKCDNHRVISVYRATNPLGPFEDIADGCITPPDWDAIDGTLFIDEQGQPWMVFVHEWTSMPDHNGSMVAAKLSEDFTHFITEPIHLFYAKDPKWATGGVTDGPYLYRTEEGNLLMVWSNGCANGYCVGLAKSESGKIDGPWTQFDKLFYEKDMRDDITIAGGHGMFLKTKEGKICFLLHGPNGRTQDGDFEHLLIYEVVEKDGIIELGQPLDL